MRIVFAAFVVVEDDAIATEPEAREFAEKELAEVNKNPDGPRIFLDAAPGEEEE